MIINDVNKMTQQPARIVSLVPSQTELLFDLGLEDKIVGITKFCVHPVHLRQNKTIIGGTKNIDINKIKTLNPQLIIANKEENIKDQVELLAATFPVLVTDVNDLSSALQMIDDIGQITHTVQKAVMLKDEIKNSFASLSFYPVINACYLIWKAPYMTIGGDTFIHDMLAHCGFRNIFAERSRYPIIDIELLKTMNCQVLLLSTEPYPFKKKHVDELKLLLPDTQVIMVDGEMFSWYGTRLLQAAVYFKSLRSMLRL